MIAETSSFQPRTSVVIVEDERIVAKDIQQTLAALGYDAFAIASSAEEAIAVVSKKCPDIVLMDIRIKGKRDGVETAGILRTQFGIPIVYLTAHADDATLERAKRTEPYGYLLKPVKSAELRSAIEVSVYRHEMEKRLRERERWFSTTLRSIADAVVTVNLAGAVTFMNPVAEELTGMAAAEAIGKPVSEVLQLLDGQTARRTATPLETVLQLREATHGDDATVVNLRDGTVRSIDESTAAVVEEGRVLGAVMVFRDVTEKKLLQRQLEVADRLASLGTMAAGVAHEVNNPLAVVVANAELAIEQIAKHRAALARAASGEPGALDGALADLGEVAQSLADIQGASERITRIVADLRAFSRPPPRAAASADVKEAVRWAVRTTSHELRHTARVVVDLADVPNVAGDGIKLGQVLVNLLINAAQAITPGRADENEIRVVARAAGGDRVVLEVHDTGPGIPAQIKPRIFDPFFTTKPVGVGTGLGLAICHGIVASLGGEISADDRATGGTVFRVVLPAASTGRAEEAIAPAPAPAPVPRRARVLAIDDEEMVLRVLKRALHEHDVVCVTSAREGLARIEAGEGFDVVLSDLMMPGMTGIELYEALLWRSPDLARRIVFMTGGIISSKFEAFMSSVPNARLQKPFDMATLLATVQRLAPP